MQCSAITTQKAVLAGSARVAAPKAVVAVPPRVSMVVKAEAVDRRAALAAVVAGGASLLSAKPAQAFLGFGGPSKEEIYTKDTSEIVAQVRAVVIMPRDAEGKEEASNAARKKINDWVAKYRRDGGVAGRPSFGNTYSALNAVAGHINSFGPTAPIPKKRLERVMKELDDADKLLARGR